MKCLQELGRPDEWFGRVEFRDDGCYEVVCRRGHCTVTVLQEEKYEILFEIGVNAILDGCYREAVASFAASLERFYQFSIFVLLEEQKVERDQALLSWKLVASQSERQLGAFIFLWLSRFQKAPSVLNGKAVEFRNEVVHKGKIPSKEEALHFGDNVLAIIQPKLLRLRAALKESMQNCIFYTIRERSQQAQIESQVSTMSVRTAFQPAERQSVLPMTVAEYLAQVKQARDVVLAPGV